MNNIKLPGNLVTAGWLAKNLNAENLIILDASMKPVTPVGDTAAADRYIPGSLRFDFDNEIKDHNTPLPHMMPTSEFFTEAAQKLGINNDSVIVAYDNVGIYASPRAWWMFHAMGHDQIAILDGGLPEWIRAGYETSIELNRLPDTKGNFIANPQPGIFVDSQFVLSILSNNDYGVVDARSTGRFSGKEPEPRPGLKQGHMPNAVNIPFTDVLENGCFKLPETLREAFNGLENKKLIFSCGSGVTACIPAFAATQAGLKNLSIYDGSWAEWGQNNDNFPVINHNR